MESQGTICLWFLSVHSTKKPKGPKFKCFNFQVETSFFLSFFGLFLFNLSLLNEKDSSYILVKLRWFSKKYASTDRSMETLAVFFSPEV